MSSVDLIVSEILEEIASSSSNTSEDQTETVLEAFNTDVYNVGHKLKMIAWDRQ